MTWIPWLQALAGLAWLAVFAQRLPGVVRLFRGVPRVADIYGLPLPVVALVQAGFSVRWWVWHKAVGTMDQTELVFWGGLYLASTASAAMFFALFRKHPPEVNR